MNEEARVWLNFMCYNLLVFAHISNVTKDGALLNYLLVNQKPISCEAIVHYSIWQYIGSNRAVLVLPHLISKVLIKKEMPSLKTNV